MSGLAGQYRGSVYVALGIRSIRSRFILTYERAYLEYARDRERERGGELHQLVLGVHEKEDEQRDYEQVGAELLEDLEGVWRGEGGVAGRRRSLAAPGG